MIGFVLFSMSILCFYFFFFFSSRRRHTRSLRDWSSDVCSSDLNFLTSRLYSPDNLTSRSFTSRIGAMSTATKTQAQERDHVDRFLETIRERLRSEERRVGKECRSRWSPDQYKKKRKE